MAHELPPSAIHLDHMVARPYRNLPSAVLQTSPVPVPFSGELPTAATLPLGLILRIVSYLDDVGDIARVTRTSRLFHYLTLPQLYRHVRLHSYAQVRTNGGRSEGFGSGSPFIMGLNGLMTKPYAALVEALDVVGEYRELGVDDYSQGRVPDTTMMLNILLRGAVDRMPKLRSFSWEMDCKPVKTLYEGLAAHASLTSLTLRFPSSASPRPCIIVPSMPNLRAFKAMDIDPDCHPDDISVLMLESRKLEDLRLHFAPRLRREGAAIANLHDYFGRCEAAGYKVKLKHISLQNFFSSKGMDLPRYIANESVQRVCFLDSVSDTVGSQVVTNALVPLPSNATVKTKHVRCNELGKVHVDILRRNDNLIEDLFIVSASSFRSGSTPSEPSPFPFTPEETDEHRSAVSSLVTPYLDVITLHHGSSMRKLLLGKQWALSQEQLSDVIRCCPNLEQFGFALNTSNHDFVRLLAPFLKHLKALRVLHNSHLEEQLRLITHEERMFRMGFDVARHADPPIHYIGLGEDVVYRIGKEYEVALEDGKRVKRRHVTMIPPSEVQHLEIWGLDNLGIGAEPYLPFSP